MTWRKLFKMWIFGYCPGLRGRFRYFGVPVHFPIGSLVFRAACAQGVFENDNQCLIGSLMRPGSHFFDVGANIGLMSIPVLKWIRKSRVTSFEPSPTVLPYLRRTVAGSNFEGRWELVEKAAGERIGRVNFALSSGVDSAYEGIRATGRAPTIGNAEVAMTTLDAEWERLGKPMVSVIKIDVEGAEMGVLRGAENLLRELRPAVLLEWHLANLSVFDVKPVAILDFAREFGYRLYSVPHLVRIEVPSELECHMGFSESFLLHGSW